MFVVEALFPFSAIVMQQQFNNQNQTEKQQDHSNELAGIQQTVGKTISSQEEKQEKAPQQQILNDAQQSENSKNQAEGAPQISYLTFQKGDKILVNQAYESGWWYGNTLKQPDIKGFFPENYVQVAAKIKPPPPPPSQQMPEQQEQQMVYAPNQQNEDWVKNQLKNINQGPIQSAYYLGIKGYKNVKIDDKNQNILKGDHVKFDVNTGLAKVPIKDQSPTAKSVRQMGYYFDYHQWCEQRNKRPGQRARPDPKKKKIKKLNLKGMK